MDNDQKLQIYQGLTKNVRELDKTWTFLKRQHNVALKTGNQDAVKVYTRLLVSVFQAFAEVNFLKTTYTPYGFSNDEIKRIVSKRSLGEKWDTCLVIGLQRLSCFKTKDLVEEVDDTVTKLIDQFVKKPSEIRNKVAHGQWVVALNSNNTAINQKTKTLMDELTFVDVIKWYKANRLLSEIIEALIESPDKAFYRDYLLLTGKLNAFLLEADTWAIDKKVERLALKRRPSKCSGNI